MQRLAAALRALPVPVIGRIENDALVLDFRCVEAVDGLITQLQQLSLHELAAPGARAEASTAAPS